MSYKTGVSKTVKGYDNVILLRIMANFLCNPYWPNISANDPDPDSGSNNLSLNRDHF